MIVQEEVLLQQRTGPSARVTSAKKLGKPGLLIRQELLAKFLERLLGTGAQLTNRVGAAMFQVSSLVT